MEETKLECVTERLGVNRVTVDLQKLQKNVMLKFPVATMGVMLHLFKFESQSSREGSLSPLPLTRLCSGAPSRGIA